jgi:transposase InsO family protein
MSTPAARNIKTLNRKLRLGEKIYNTIRPHQSLGYPRNSSSANSIPTISSQRQE